MKKEEKKRTYGQSIVRAHFRPRTPFSIATA